MGSEVEATARVGPSGAVGTGLVVAGAVAGAVVAAIGLVGRPPAAPRVPEGAVALVNGVPVERVDFERALAAVAADRRAGALDRSVRQHVLDRVIDEELLVQRGLELGLAERDARVRADLSGAVIRLVVNRAEAELREPDDELLHELYAAHPEKFGTAPRLLVERALFAAPTAAESDSARARAEAARRAFERGAAFAEVIALGELPAVVLPRAPIAPDKLRDYLGPTVARATLALAPGQVSAPLRSAQGYELVHLVALEPGRRRRFEEVRELVLAEYRRSAGERALRELLARRRQSSEIAVAAAALAAPDRSAE